MIIFLVHQHLHEERKLVLRPLRNTICLLVKESRTFLVGLFLVGPKQVRLNNRSVEILVAYQNKQYKTKDLKILVGNEMV
jgi:hypothetical protein